jgi:hypothetical protein
LLGENSALGSSRMIRQRQLGRGPTSRAKFGKAPQRSQSGLRFRITCHAANTGDMLSSFPSSIAIDAKAAEVTTGCSRLAGAH